MESQELPTLHNLLVQPIKLKIDSILHFTFNYRDNMYWVKIKPIVGKGNRKQDILDKG